MPSRGKFLFILGTTESRIREKRNAQSNSGNEREFEVGRLRAASGEILQAQKNHSKQDINRF
jgi:uncharacterized membrane protein